MGLVNGLRMFDVYFYVRMSLRTLIYLMESHAFH